MIIFEWLIIVVAAWMLSSKTIIFLIIFAALLPLELLCLNYLFKVLKSAHCIDAKGLLVQLSGYVRFHIPWQQIAGAVPCQNIELPPCDGLGRYFTIMESGLYCLGFRQDLLCISLKEEMTLSRRVKRNLRGLPFCTVYLNADERDSFLVAIDTHCHADDQRVSLANSGITDTRQDLKCLFANAQEENTDRREAMLELRDITFSYGGLPVVDCFNLSVMPGEIVAFLGPNGAGKSTTLNMITGLLKPQAGQVLLHGTDIWSKEGRQRRSQIGFVPEPSILYTRLTAKEHLHYIATLYDLPYQEGKEKINKLIALLEMEIWCDKLIHSYSQGMKRKVSLAISLLIEPKLLIIDELTNSFDAATIAKIEQIFFAYRQSGKSILFTGHVLPIAEKLADRVCIMNKGICVAYGALNDLKQQANMTGLEELYFSSTGEDWKMPI